MPRFTRRCQAVRQACAARGVDALLVTSVPNVAYLTGLRATAAAALVDRERLVLITDARYLTQAAELAAAEQAPDGLKIRPVRGTYDETIAALLAAAPRMQVAVEAAHLTLGRWTWLRETLGSAVTLVPVDGVVEAGRVVKDAAEIAAFRAAGTMLADCAERVVAGVRAGRTEREIAAEIDATVSGAGFEDRAFPPIVASGPNGALPHARPTGRKLEPGDVVVVDFGGVHQGYSVDLTRTVGVGTLAAEPRRWLNAVAAAQQAAISTVRPGVVASEVDAAARAVLDRAGLAEAFGHSTGHGLGLEVHEAPRIGRTGERGSDVRLAAGMVFTVEPGVYLPGQGGVRIEDDVLVTRDGCEVLTAGRTRPAVPDA